MERKGGRKKKERKTRKEKEREREREEKEERREKEKATRISLGCKFSLSFHRLSLSLSRPAPCPVRFSLSFPRLYTCVPNVDDFVVVNRESPAQMWWDCSIVWSAVTRTCIRYNGESDANIDNYNDSVVSTLSDSDIEAYICVRMQAWCSVTSISSDAIYVCDALVVVVVVIVVVVVVVVVIVVVVVVFMADENSGPTNNHHGQMGNRDFLISVATNKLRFALVLRMNNNRVCFSVAFYETSRFSFNNFNHY